MQSSLPERDDELAMLQAVQGAAQSPDGKPLSVTGPSTLDDLQSRVTQLLVALQLSRYLMELAWRCRSHADAHAAVSQRCLLTWQRTAQAWAFLRNGSYVIPDGIQAVARPVLAVRTVVTDDGSIGFLRELPQAIPVLV